MPRPMNKTMQLFVCCCCWDCALEGGRRRRREPSESESCDVEYRSVQFGRPRESGRRTVASLDPVVSSLDVSDGS